MLKKSRDSFDTGKSCSGGLFPTLWAIHLDLKGMPPRMERLLQLLELFAKSGYNALLVEWEDMFPWKEQAWRSVNAYTKAEVKKLVARASALQLEIIPLIQTFGHMENVLRNEKYARFRELDWLNSDLHPSPESRKLITGMISEILDLLPEIHFFHLGGDEVGSIGLGHSKTDPALRKGMCNLYLTHMGAFGNFLQKKGIRPLIWHDMLAGGTASELKKAARMFDVAIWGAGNLQVQAERFLNAGARIWGSPCFKGADGIASDLPDLSERCKVIRQYLELTANLPFTGLIACGWSRYSAQRTQCEPLEGALFLSAVAGRMFSGDSDPDRGALECLKQCGLLEDYMLSKQLLEKLSSLRTRCKRYFFDALELSAAQQRLQVQRDSKIAWYYLKIKSCLQEGESLKLEFHAHFDRFVAEKNVEDYFEERMIPFRRLLKLIQQDCEKFAHPDAEDGYKTVFGV